MLPWISAWVEPDSLKKIPDWRLATMRLPGAGSPPGPPIVVWSELMLRMPMPPLPTGKRPVESVPILLDWMMVAEAENNSMPATGLPEMMLPAALVVPPIVVRTVVVPKIPTSTPTSLADVRLAIGSHADIVPLDDVVGRSAAGDGVAEDCEHGGVYGHARPCSRRSSHCCRSSR